jgi:hypothetical protein
VKKFCSFLPALCVLSVLVASSLQGGRISSKRGPTPVPTHPEVLISSVTGSSVTVTVQTVSDKGQVFAKTNKTYTVTKFTEIQVNRQKATIVDLKPGMRVSVTAGMDPSQAARITAEG